MKHLSMLLALCFALSLLPAGALAADESGGQEPPSAYEPAAEGGADETETAYGPDTAENGETAADEARPSPDEAAYAPAADPEDADADAEDETSGLDGAPPAKPDGEQGGPGGPGGNPPGDPPDGDPPGDPPGDAPGGDPPGDPPGDAPGGQGGGPGGGPGGSANVNYTAPTTITSADEQSNQAYASSAADESALIINTSEDVTINSPTVTKTGSSNGGDSCSFYGLNAAVLAMGGTTAAITGGSITSNANGANGVFSYGGNGGSNGKAGDGTTVVIRDTVITTTGSGSGGIMTTGGGVTYAYDLTVTTSGGSSAPIRTDRGGGTVVVDGGTYTSNGLGSPAIYSTADVTVKNAALISNLSEGVCIEGKNSITLVNCDLTANNTRMNGNASFLDSIMIYQSMSGDADSGTSSFRMTGGSLTSRSGHMFHVTNTSAVIDLSGVRLVNEDPDNVLISVCADGWSGASNAAALNADAQVLDGAVLVGGDSRLTMSLKNGSVFTGSVGGSITNAKGTVVSSSVGTVDVTLEDSSIWVLTEDSYISSFTGDPAKVYANGHTLYVDGTALAGVSGSYPPPADTPDGPGDVNADGVIDLADRAYLARALSDGERYPLPEAGRPDMNGDGSVDRLDRIGLARALLAQGA